MPTIKKHRYSRDYAGTLSEAHIEFLVSGFCLDGDELGELDRNTMPFTCEEEAKRAYRKHKAAIFAAAKDQTDSRWLQVDGKWTLEQIPRPLPWAWWKWEATEPKLQLAGPEPLPDSSFWFGEPQMWENFEEYRKAVFETDHEYCERLELNI